jgi:hypothetical protein
MPVETGARVGRFRSVLSGVLALGMRGISWHARAGQEVLAR